MHLGGRGCVILYKYVAANMCDYVGRQVGWLYEPLVKIMEGRGERERERRWNMQESMKHTAVLFPNTGWEMDVYTRTQ